MGLVALVVGSSRITMDAWLDCISRTENLTPAAARTTVNPFTRQALNHVPPPGEVVLRLGENAVGAIAPSAEFDEDGVLEVFAPHPAMAEDGRRLVECIAAQLSAEVRWLPP